MPVDLVIANGQVVTERGVRTASVAVDRGAIVGIGPEGRLARGRRRIDADGLVVLPGIIDPHVHLGVGGTADEAKLVADFGTETRAAALGGITTFVTDHESEVGPSLVTITQETRLGRRRVSLLDKAKNIGESHSAIDFRFTANPQSGAHLQEIPRLIDQGVSSFKFYPAFHQLGEHDWGIRRVDWGFLYQAFERLAGAKTPELAPLGMVHCEELDVCAVLKTRAIESSWETSLHTWNRTRPPIAEAMHVFDVGLLAKETGARGYIVHISSRIALDTLRYVKQLGADLIGETCAHYLVLDDQADLERWAKTNPPLRSPDDIEALWEAVESHTVELVGSDDCGRYTREEKLSTSFWESIPGFSEMAATLPLLITHGVAQGRLGWRELAQLLSTRPARYFGMYPRKGTIRVGSDADFVLVDRDQTWTFTHKGMQYPSDFSIYEGHQMIGRPVQTILRGEIVADNGAVLAEPGSGQYVADGKPRLT